jgi:hypothetical protein
MCAVAVLAIGPEILKILMSQLTTQAATRRLGITAGRKGTGIRS